MRWFLRGWLNSFPQWNRLRALSTLWRYRRPLFLVLRALLNTCSSLPTTPVPQENALIPPFKAHPSYREMFITVLHMNRLWTINQRQFAQETRQFTVTKISLQTKVISVYTDNHSKYKVQAMEIDKQMKQIFTSKFSTECYFFLKNRRFWIFNVCDIIK